MAPSASVKKVTRYPMRLFGGMVPRARTIGRGLAWLAGVAWAFGVLGQTSAPPATVYGRSYQVNVGSQNQNIVGDAANEPSLCVDPTDPDRMAIGWRQFDTVTNDFRQAGWAYSADGGQTWTVGGVLETNVFRSDPVLAADADGRFYYLSVLVAPNYHCDLWRSTNGGMAWQRLGPALGGDKPWLAIDTTAGAGRGNLYEVWSRWYNFDTNANTILSRSADGGLSWAEPGGIPQLPYWGTLAVGPAGELYSVGWDGSSFWVSRSTNAPEAGSVPTFDLNTVVDLGGRLGAFVTNSPNPGGLLGQPWIAADRSAGPTRGNVYVLGSVQRSGQAADVMFARSTDRGATWSAPRRINDDAPGNGAWHWFGTLAVAPDGRVDACWYDTRGDPTNAPTNAWCALYYSASADGGLTWSPNRAISPPFNPSLGYPAQDKIGDYISMVALDGAACIAYAATFNGEEDVYFVKVEPPIILHLVEAGGELSLWWNTVPGKAYTVEAQTSLGVSWSSASMLGSLVATGWVTTLPQLTAGGGQRFYRVVEPPP